MFLETGLILRYDLKKGGLLYIQNYIPRGQKPEFKDQTHWRVKEHTAIFRWTFPVKW